uniref:Methyltranfer_dom domain-containing protein n=1 Tax=Steinernema glaseri TaxID=37863 RepID=A0A1I7Z317_9BILA
MNALQDAVIEQIAGLLPFKTLPILLEAVTGHHNWQRFVEAEHEYRCDVHLTFGVGQLEGKILCNAQHSPFREDGAVFKKWDLKKKHLARVSNITITGGSFPEDERKEETLTTLYNLCKLPVLRGKDEQKTVLHIGETPKSHEAILSRLIDHLPTAFEEVSVIMVKEQPQVLTKVAEHLNTTSNLALQKLTILDCGIDQNILSPLGDIFLSRKNSKLALVVSNCSTKFSADSLLQLIKKFRESDVECRGERTMSLEMTEDEWSVVAERYKSLGSIEIEDNSRKYCLSISQFGVLIMLRIFRIMKRVSFGG